MNTDDLIAALAADLRPVRRAPAPGLVTASWAMAAAVAIGLGALYFGPGDGIVARIAGDLPQVGAAVATGLLAAFAAFQLALPDRDRRWGLLPLPAAGLWLAVLGWGCVQDVLAGGPAALALTTSYRCLGFIAGLGLPLAAGVLWLSRHAAGLRPGPVAALAGLAAASLASAGLSCVHDLHAAAMVLVWHGMAVLLVTAIAALLGPRILRGAIPA
ncbi:MAG: DUF1109 family protein [Acetobacteraceae bacterium]|nr:DUF1109 family protein [Acetobacteraceae bacterium]